MPTLDVAGVPVAYRAAGRGETVIALHSSASSGKQWEALAERIGEDFRVVAPDLFGYGRTPDWPGPAPLRLADEAAIVAALAGDQPVHLVGHSYGGVVALRALVDGRVAVRSLTVVEPVAFFLLRDGDADDAALWDEPAGVAAAVTAAVAAGDAAGGMAHFVDYWNGRGSWAGMPPRRRAGLAARTAKVASDFAVIGGEMTRAADYAAITAPTLVLRGEQTKPPTRRIAELLAATIPGAAYHVMPGAGHMAPVVDPAPVNALIAEHLYRHAGGAELDGAAAGPRPSAGSG